MKCLSKFASGNALLLDYVAGRLESAEAAQVAAHLHDCAACRSQVDGQAQLWYLLDNWEAGPVSRHFNRHLYARMERERPLNLWQWSKQILNGWVARPVMPLAVLSMLIIAGIFIERPQVSATAHPAVAEEPVVVSPTDAEQLDKALDDLQLLHQLDSVKDEAVGASKRM